MSKETLLWLVFSGFFIAPMMLAMAVGWMQRQWYMRQAAPAKRRQARHRLPTTREELNYMAEYQRRWRRALGRCWGAWCVAIVVMMFGLPLTSLALAVLVPLLAVVEHLRCPACDSTPTLNGLAEGCYCRRCGNKLKV